MQAALTFTRRRPPSTHLPGAEAAAGAVSANACAAPDGHRSWQPAGAG
ncbi:hypothetical protein [Streptomyces phaeoluteigriseus]